MCVSRSGSRDEAGSDLILARVRFSGGQITREEEDRAPLRFGTRGEPTVACEEAVIRCTVHVDEGRRRERGQ